MDRVVKDRLAREREKYADHEDLKKKAARLEEIEAESQSELEKAQAAALKAEENASKATEVANERLVKAAILSEAAKQGAKNGEVVLRALDRTGLTVEDNGDVSGVEEAVKSLLDEIPEFVGSRKREDADQGARGGKGDDQVSQAELAQMTPAEINAALKAGKLSQLL